MRIGKRIIVTFITVGASVSMVSLFALAPLRSRLIVAADIHVPALDAIQSVEADLKGAVRESFAYVVSGEEVAKEEFLHWADGFSEQLQRFAALAHFTDPGDQRKVVLLERITQEQRTLVVQASVMFSEYAATGSVSQTTLAAYETSIDSLVPTIEEFVRIERTEIEEAHALATLRTAEWYLIAIALGALLCAVVAGSLIARSITRPLSRLNSIADKVGAGNLNCRANVESRDEIEQLGGAFDRMTAALRKSRDELTTRLEERTEDITKLKLAEQELRDNSVVLVDALKREKCVASELEVAMCQLKAVMTELEVAATTDTLTGLPNRAVFLDRLEQSIKRSNRDGSRFAVLFFDFDRFKVINDSLGHDVGDRLLCSIADIFRREVRESDTVARLGGDEFIVLLNCLSEWSDADKTATRLLNVFAEPHTVADHQIVSTASIGLVTNEHTYQCVTDVIRDADAAMYQAKTEGRARIVSFDSAMHERAMNRLSLETDLRFAIAEDQLRLVYQPIVDLATGAVSGFEALIRWDHTERGVVSPIEFIPIADETGLIIEIGQWVLRTACRQIADWNRRLGLEANLSMSVNVSERQLLGSSFIDDVLECLREFDVPAEELKLEVTESVFSDGRCEVAPVLIQLREHGLHIAMDDFGTGLSSLSALHEYPIDLLKIDQSFARNLEGNRSFLAVVASVTALAENIGITTVAEGIETAEIIAALRSIGCTWGQGYYFAKPMTPADAEAYILDIHKEKRGA